MNNKHARVPALPLIDARESMAPGAFIERVPVKRSITRALTQMEATASSLTR